MRSSSEIIKLSHFLYTKSSTSYQRFGYVQYYYIHPSIYLFSRRIRISPLVRPLAERIREMIDGRRHQPNGRLEGRLVRRIGMRARRDEHLGPPERPGQVLALLFGQGLLQLDQVVGLFLLDVLGQVVHQALDGWDESRVGGLHILEFGEFFFDLPDRF